MNIDLLRTKAGEFGIVCDTAFEEAPRAALFDTQQGVLSLEFGTEDGLVCNVPVVEEWRVQLGYEDSMIFGCIVNGVVSTAERIPLKALL